MIEWAPGNPMGHRDGTQGGSIGVMNFWFFDPGDFGPGGRHRPDLEVKKSRSPGLTPWFYVAFSHNSLNNIRKWSFWRYSGHESPFNQRSHGLDPTNLCSSSWRIAWSRSRIHISELWIMAIRGWDPEVGRGGHGGQKMKFPRFDPIILGYSSHMNHSRIFVVAIPWSRPRNQSSKQMIVYDQIWFSYIFVSILI